MSWIQYFDFYFSGEGPTMLALIRHCSAIRCKRESKHDNSLFSNWAFPREALRRKDHNDGDHKGFCTRQR
jgi:hypothetical protein